MAASVPKDGVHNLEQVQAHYLMSADRIEAIRRAINKQKEQPAEKQEAYRMDWKAKPLSPENLKSIKAAKELAKVREVKPKPEIGEE